MAENRHELAAWTARIAAAWLIALCFSAWSPASLFAQTAPEDETCVSCHQEEGTSWEHSPHGSVAPESAGDTGGASCVDCHGEYVKGHPAEGPMSLSVDSSICQDCHEETFSQWEPSYHAASGVQCISCHRPHTQDLRLTDETLCQSCHRESLDDAFHSAHWQGEVTCTSCHLADTPHMQSVASSDPALGVTLAPTHDFVTVSGQNCLECHKDAVALDQSDSAAATRSVAQTIEPEIPATGINGMALGLASLSAANLGFGLGIGGILGIVFMLVAANYGFGRKQS